MEKTDEVLATALSSVIAQMDSLTTEYGAATVELAFRAIQMEALSIILQSLIWLAVIVAGVFATKMLNAWRLAPEDAYSDRHMVFGAWLVPFALASIGTLSLVVSPLSKGYIWLAAFGYPEVYIATQALKSAGLL